MSKENPSTLIRLDDERIFKEMEREIDRLRLENARLAAVVESAKADLKNIGANWDISPSGLSYDIQNLRIRLAQSPSTALAEFLGPVIKAIEDASVYLVRAELPEPSHPGFCGPESPCDGICVDIANASIQNAAIDRLSKQLAFIKTISS